MKQDDGRSPPDVPRIAQSLLLLFASRDPSLVGDLAEQFHRHHASEGLLLARLHYWWEVLHAIPVLANRRVRRSWRRRSQSGPLPGPRRRSDWGTHDLGHVVRTVWRSPGQTLIAVSTLALGVGLNAAVFSVVDGVLFRPLPYHEPSQLALIWARDRGTGGAYLEMIQTDLEKLTTVPGIEALVGFGEDAALLIDAAGEPVRVNSSYSFGNLFGVLGVEPLIGRPPTIEELEARTPVIVISHRLWRGRYGASPEILGRAVPSDHGTFTVVGVAPDGFHFPAETDIWYAPPEWVELDDAVKVLARLAPGERASGMSERLGAVSVRGRGSFMAEQESLKPWAEPLQSSIVSRARTPLVFLLAASGAVLLLASANVANLFLARGLAREGEWSLRSALGATRVRIARQVIMESVLISALGGAIAGFFVLASFDAILSLVPKELPRLDEIAFNGRVFAIMMGTAVLAGLGAGFIPALRASLTAPANGLGSGHRGTTRAEGRRLQSLLISAELALGTVLVLGAFVMALTLRNLHAVHPGFRTDVLTVRAMNVGWSRGDPNLDRAAVWDEILERVQTLPGVQAAAAAALHPMEREFVVNVHVVGRENADGTESSPTTMFFPVSDGYLATVGIPLIAGRGLAHTDDARAAGVAMVNESFVRRYLPDTNPLGRMIRKERFGGPWGPSETVEVVGVVGDVKSQGLAGDSEPMMFIPLKQSRFGYMRLFVRSASDPLALIPSIREIIWAADPTVPLPNFQTMDEVVRESLAQEVFLSRIIGVFALLGLLLAVVGVYGVVSFAVGQRTREICIRRALGASSAGVAKLVGCWAFVRIAAGIAVGTAAAVLVDALLRGVLFGISATTPWVLASVTTAMAFAGAVAACGPTRRALDVDPADALRAE